MISGTKGIEEDTMKLMTQVMEDVLPAPTHRSLMALSGPSFAAELSAGQPTAVCLAGRDEPLVRQFQSALMTPAFRVYADADVIGVQLGGALKNVMALAAGIIDGLGLGLNARAALITRGLAEIVRLGAAMGADLHGHTQPELHGGCPARQGRETRHDFKQDAGGRRRGADGSCCVGVGAAVPC
jgi:glycerol-3-phosphate dehydrogenase (NAD(P)+)